MEKGVDGAHRWETLILRFKFGFKIHLLVYIITNETKPNYQPIKKSQVKQQ